MEFLFCNKIFDDGGVPTWKILASSDLPIVGNSAKNGMQKVTWKMSIATVVYRIKQTIGS